MDGGRGPRDRRFLPVEDRRLRRRVGRGARCRARARPDLRHPVALSVYLSGEIHTDWRERIQRGAVEAGLDVVFTSPVTDHPSSDDCGVAILGAEDQKFWADHKGAGVNSIRTRTLIEAAQVVVVRFGEQYRQWNAAFEAGYAAALGKPLVTLHPPEHDHALKEVDRAASAVAREPEQVVALLRYVLTGELPG